MMSATLRVDGLRYQRSSGAASDSGFAIEVGSLQLSAGEALGVVGPSGCGKSTLVDLLALLRRPSAIARFELAGHDVASLWRDDDVDACTALRARHIGVVLQTGGLLPSLSVRDNVRLAQRLLGRPDEAWIDSLLDRLELGALAGRQPAQLSIGQRQRVAIARAVAHRPALVLADEPTAALGGDHAPAAIRLLLAVAQEGGSALVIVSHDLALLQAHGVPLRHCVLHAGGVVLEPVP
jgi:putative ABC transport system ATP-binding protein